LGPIENLNNILLNQEIDNVIVALPNVAANKIQEVFQVCEMNGKNVKMIPDFLSFVSSKYSISTFGKLPVISINDEKIDQFYWRFWKRFFDILISLFVSVFVLSWLYPLCALLIKLDSKGPVIFRQERWGRDNKKFTAYKFRSMYCNSRDTDHNGKFIQASANDPRISRIGMFLRRTNIDEIPQFINVLKGEMSVVGPRPHPTPLNMESKLNISYYLKRHHVKPGITGWAQINGFRGETSEPEQMIKRVEYDLWYIENWSYILDTKIFFMTIWSTLAGDPNAY
jgi:putative colanic acid biosynthesis UDP-glucose lipid carrier transferase